MSIHSLRRGDKFTLERKRYEVDFVGERVIMLYCLDDKDARIKDRCSPDGFKTTIVSDMRYYREHPKKVRTRPTAVAVPPAPKKRRRP